MQLLKTYINPKQQYLECEYKHNYPTYWFMEKEISIWSTGMMESYRTCVPIGYVYNQTTEGTK